MFSSCTLAVLLCVSSPGAGASAKNPATLFVAQAGNDANPGTARRPFATLERARDELRERKPAGGAVVVVNAGDYLLAHTFELTAVDSAPPEARIEYRAAPGAVVVLSGGVEVTGFRPYKGRIVQADVRALGLDKAPAVHYARYGGDVPGFELFFRGRRMTLARWPNKIPGDPRWGRWAHIPKTTAETRKYFYYPGDRPSHWAHPEEAQVHWFPWYNYMDQFVGVKSVDVNRKTIELAQPAVYAVQPGRRFYVRNVFEELDAPGEWYLDRRKGVLYFWPPQPLTRGRVVASRLDTLVRLTDTRNVTLRGFTLETCRGDAVVVQGGRGNIIGGCTIRNAFQDGIHFAGGSDNGALGNDIYEVGRRGILLEGGDRETLTPARNYARNNHIHHVSRVLHTYAPAIQVTGCGNLVQHNLIHDGPHMLIGLSGNDHLLEYNEIHHAMLITSHGGAFYCGRDYTARGNVLRFNKFHDITGYGIDKIDTRRGVFIYASPVRHLPGAFGIHLDDQISGFHIYGNVFYRLAHGVIRLGGGRDCRIENNVFVDAGWAVHIDNRGMGWQKKQSRTGTLWRRLQAVDYKHPPWSIRYPELVALLTDRFGEPVDNVVQRNIFVQRETLYSFSRVPADRFTCDFNLLRRPDGQPLDVSARTYHPNQGGEMPLADWQKLGFDRHSLVADPRFRNAAADDYRLRADSPAWRLGFKPIPAEKIGLYRDEWRTSPLPPPDPRKAGSKQIVEEYPIPGWAPPPAQERVELSVPAARTEITIDGRLQSTEWSKTQGAQRLELKVDPQGRPVTFPSSAWVTHDGANLFVAVSSLVDPKRSVSKTNQWGIDDAVEVAVQDESGKRPGPIVVLRGYPNGTFQSSTEAGAPAVLARAVGQAVTFAAGVPSPGRWDCEWKLPLAALNVKPPRPAYVPKLRFNLTVHNAVTREWGLWNPTHGHSWDLADAGVLLLTLPHGG